MQRKLKMQRKKENAEKRPDEWSGLWEGEANDTNYREGEASEGGRTKTAQAGCAIMKRK